jgi:L-alanine-DL-glutamate epimerase-like enolase superfamily enzyme
MMKIERINIHQILLPFFDDFPHSLRKGAFARNVVVEIVAQEAGLRGYGECAPRSYVTGELPETVPQSVRLFLETGCFPWQLEDISQVWDFVDHAPYNKAHNAALCALEMAMLDILGREEERPIIEYFPKTFRTDLVHYGAAFPLDSRKRITEMAHKVKHMGIYRLKLKMGRDLCENKDNVEGIYAVFGHDADLKVDVNGAWDHEVAFNHLPLIQEFRVKVVEQPMMPGDPGIGSFAKALTSHNIKVMADESACTEAEVRGIIREGHYDMINVRLSKCGGFRRSFRIIDYAREREIPFQIACQLGESGLLSAAGRALSLLCRDALYHDGSYDDFLLRENTTEKNVGFGPGGAAGPLKGPGLGVRVNPQNLARLREAPITTYGP